jgi:hypothetical protein
LPVLSKPRRFDPSSCAQTRAICTVERDVFLHKNGARRPDALNPGNSAIDANAFSIAANRVFMSRLFMNLTTNIQHYREWTAFLKDWQPKMLILWGIPHRFETPSNITRTAIMPRTTTRRDPKITGRKPPSSPTKQSPPGKETKMAPKADHGEDSYVSSSSWASVLNDPSLLCGLARANQLAHDPKKFSRRSRLP